MPVGGLHDYRRRAGRRAHALHPIQQRSRGEKSCRDSPNGRVSGARQREQQSIAPTAADNVGTGNPMYYSNDSLWGALNLPWLDHPRVR